MAPHLLEEAYEAVEALQAEDPAASCEELGDVLMNVLMIARIASEAERYDVEDVARGIADKLVRRHPHVFGDAEVDDTDHVLANWEAIKRREKAGAPPRAVLSGVPADLPALLRAHRVGEKAARTGFDWPDARGPRNKLSEEIDELDEALASGNREAIEHELGDVLFSVVNVARHAGVNSEMALRRTVQRFVQRFGHVEEQLGDRLESASLEEMEDLWQQAKKRSL
jgi:MazG family protein